MNINDFINEYNDSQNKEEIIKKHIINRYIPYERKIAICNNIVKSADYTPVVEVTDRSYYSPNTPIRFVFFCISLIQEYTDIELDMLDKKIDVIGSFNKLDKVGVIEEIISELGREYKILKTVLEMVVNDTECKESNLVNFFTTKFDSMKALYDASLPIIEDKIINFPKREK